MIFNTFAPDYHGPLQRSAAMKEQDERVETFFKKEDMERPIIETDQIGMTVVDGQQGNFLQSVQAAIRQGAGKIELEPMPEGNPNSGIEIYGKERREQLKEMAKAAGVEITSVHAHHSLVGNVSGMGREGFSEGERSRQINEVKRAMEFAGDIADGSGVVFHTGEFPRSVFDRYKDFEAYEGEKKDAIHYIVDGKTGQIIKSVRENEDVWVPKQNEEHKWELDEKGNKLLDEFNEPIPRWQIDDKNEIIVERMQFKDFVDEKIAMNPELAKLAKDEYVEAKKKIVVDFFKEQQQAEINHQLGQSRQYEDMYIEGIDRNKKIKAALKEYKEIDRRLPEEDKWRLQQVIRDRYDVSGILPPEIKDSIKYLEEQLRDNERQMAYGREITLSGRKNAKRLKYMLNTVEHIEDYAIKKSTDSIADLGIYAMNMTKERKMKNPMRILPENMLPEMGFGSHPEEMKKLILRSRKRMTDKLVERGVDQGHAKKAATEHIRSLLDTAHLGNWWKHYKGDPDWTQEKKREEFNKWYMKQVKMLEKNDIITNVHIADGSGYTDSALTPGQGSLPVAEAVEYLQKKYKEKGKKLNLNSEAYADPATILTGVWQAFGSPIYATQRPIPSGSMWSDVHQAYYGTTQSPYFVYGEYSPSEEWAPWSATKME